MRLCQPQHYAVLTAMHHIMAEPNDATVIEADLMALGTRYAAITESGKHIKPGKDNATLALVKCLDECDYISSYTVDDSSIKVNTKRIK